MNNVPCLGCPYHKMSEHKGRRAVILEEDLNIGPFLRRVCSVIVGQHVFEGVFVAWVQFATIRAEQLEIERTNP